LTTARRRVRARGLPRNPVTGLRYRANEVIRFAILPIAAGLAGWVGVTAAAAPGTTPTVPCADRIAVTRFPYRESGYRVVLGVISAPPAYLPQDVVATHRRPWTYWLKQGLVVRANGMTVTVSVPARWRARAAITWGNNTGIVSSLRIAGCGSDQHAGNAYAGGFFLRARSGCVPLIFRVGTRSAIVRFGIGRRCA